VKVLLDTHVLLWTAVRPDRLPPAVRIVFDDPGNELFFSAASVWEVVIKRGLGRPDSRWTQVCCGADCWRMVMPS
jgi:PIN domain nuclease of toxin-antitoxin system